MAPPVPDISSTVAVLAAELDELGKRPVSPETYAKLREIRERLDELVGEFVLCDRCGNLYPDVAQLTFGGKTANLCPTCAITVLQRGGIDGPPGRSAGKRASARPKRTSPTPPAAPEPEPEPEIEEESEPSAAEDEIEDVVEISDEPPVDEDEEETERASRPSPRPGNRRGSFRLPPPEHTESGNGSNGEGAESDEEDGEQARVPTSVTSPRRTARHPKPEQSQFKATVAEVSKHLKRPPREVRQIGKLIEEISPPMDTEKTTRYVVAELRNTRSKIPVDVVTMVVASLKDGVAGGEPGDGRG